MRLADAVAAFRRGLDRQNWSGDVLDGDGALAAWSVDHSICHIVPGAVVFPRTTGDLAALARVASRHCVPLVARGGGTGTNSQCALHHLAMPPEAV